MKNYKNFTKYSLLFAFSLVSLAAYAQPVNNTCLTATTVSGLNNWCSTSGQFTNVAATSSSFNTTCFNSANDVWFSFVAAAPSVTITVNGNTSGGSAGGTMTNPNVALITNPCGGTQTIVQCQASTSNIAQIHSGGLIVGQTYYILVDATIEGTFQLCVDNYNPIPDPQSDCIDAVVLCDKSPFTVQSVSGAGNDPDEAGSSSCLGSLGGNSESNSTWYVWVCDAAGSLTFDLTPSNPNDDLDFVLYELPNGIGDCANKIEQRCMASGNFTTPSPCMGVTGLNSTSTDVTESSGCSTGDDNFLQELTMVSGSTYALLINNFTSTGNGFGISFGGTGTFRGPVGDVILSDINADICAGETITVSDNSSYPSGNIASIEWYFGVDATPASATGAGPHSISYSSTGTKSIVHIVTSDEGCIVTGIETVEVNPCCSSLNQITASGTTTNVNCAPVLDGSIAVNFGTSFAPITYDWSDPTLSGNNLTGLGAGSYTVTMTDDIGCDTVLNFTITSPPPYQISNIIQQPTCAGGQDGSLTMNVAGGTPPYMYNFGTGFQTNPTIANIGNGIYNVTVRDANNCDTTMAIRVWEVEIELDTINQFLFPPSCFGYSDGSIAASPANGNPPFLYDWGSGFTPNNTLNNLTAGTYSLTVMDANLCQGIFNFTLTQPDSLQTSITKVDVSCFGGNDGEATVNVIGGVGNYQYLWSNQQTSATAIDLIAGNYTVMVADGNGCQQPATTIINQPPEIIIDSVQVVDVYCFGDSDGQITVFASGGTPPFEYSVNDTANFQTSNVLTGLSAGTYTVMVLDVFNCIVSQEVTVNQPWEFWIEAGPDQTVDLGYSVDIDALVNTNPPVTYNWTPLSGIMSCTDCEDPTITPFETTTYVVEATDSRGCTVYDSLTIFVDTKRPYFVPNAYTPNFDGTNDYFYVQGGPAISNVKVMKVFDRWGSLVFESENMQANDESIGWDGTFRGRRVDPAVFVYYIEIEFIDGYVEKLKGDVTLIR